MLERYAAVVTLFLLAALVALPAMAAPPAGPSPTPTHTVAPVVDAAIAPAVQSQQCTAPAAGVDDPLAKTEAASAPTPQFPTDPACTDLRCFDFCGPGGGGYVGGRIPCICCAF